MKTLDDYKIWLTRKERSDATISKYLHDIKCFLAWLGEKELSCDNVLAWKDSLIRARRNAKTINGMISALNSYFTFLKLWDCKLTRVRIQHDAFRDSSREMTKKEYHRLTDAARESGNGRTLLMLQVLAGTGVRVSELSFITVEAAKRKRAEVYLKGKSRQVIIAQSLAKKLLSYARKHGITTGPILVTSTGKPLSRQQVWRELKRLHKRAGVARTKVFPHNFRHLFARCLYAKTKDIAVVADVLGHSSIETTRIYLTSTSDEYEKKIDQLELVC